tara:strand:- start:2365 stop:3231 length:867 start_codon:yes stop_codon:yes gene_type:complete
MNLQFLLPEVSGFGVWQIDTGSTNSILNVNNALDLVRQIYDRVSMVPLVLALEPKEVTNPDDGKKKTVRVLNIRSEDKMIEAFRKSRMAPLALVQGMAGEIYEDGDKLELPEAGDTAPFVDFPPETPVADLDQAAKDTADLWPDGSTPNADRAASEAAKTAEPQATTEPTATDGEENAITMIAQADSLPDGKPGMRLQVIETNEILVWEQVAQGGRWRNIGINPPPAKPPEPDAPKSVGEFFTWLQGHGKKFGPTWFYKTFSNYTAETMKQSAIVAEAYAEVKEIQGW